MRPDRNQRIAAALRLLADAFEAPDGPANDSPDAWVDVASYLRGALPKRRVLAACRAGQIVGVVKRGRSWVGKSSAIDLWLASSQPEGAQESTDLIARWARAAAGGER